jgi:N-acyl-D-amino-acid deacylase
MRDEGDGLFASIDETLSLADTAGIPVIISHLKCASPAMWGRSAEALRRIEDAAQSQRVAFDVYPYDASSTMLRPDRLEGSRRVVVSWSDPHPDMAGRDLADIAQCWCCSPQQAAARLSPGGAIYYKMQEADIRRIIAHPLAMVGSDGLPHDRHPHPRLWGTFPRVLGHYVRDLQILDLPEAIRKMTSLPAQAFCLPDRGRVEAGLAADIVLFDPTEIIDTATYETPVTPARGIVHVLVNGALAWTEGRATGMQAGRVLSRDQGRQVSLDRRAVLPAGP